jgi:hypothetical protein
MPGPPIIVKRGISRIVESSVSPVVSHADISCPVVQHVARQTQISLPIHGQVSAGGVSSSLSYARVSRLYRLHSISLSVRTRNISLTDSGRIVSLRSSCLTSCNSRTARSGLGSSGSLPRTCPGNISGCYSVVSHSPPGGCITSSSRYSHVATSRRRIHSSNRMTTTASG